MIFFSGFWRSGHVDLTTLRTSFMSSGNGGGRAVHHKGRSFDRKFSGVDGVDGYFLGFATTPFTISAVDPSDG